VKEATTLANAGYEVEVVTAQLEPALVGRDVELSANAGWIHTPLLRAGTGRIRDNFHFQRARARRKMWTKLGTIAGIGDVRQFGYVGPEMLEYSLTDPVDLTIVHLPQALWVGAELIARGKKVAVDFEDWYSEDFPASKPSPVSAAVLAKWEKRVLRGSVHSTTTSQVLSDALAAAYEVASPAVLPNSFSIRERETIDGDTRDRVDLSIPSLTWFSQVIGPDRGIETLIRSLAKVASPIEIHFRGKITESYRLALLDMAPANWRDLIFFHAQVSHRELISRLAEHDLGLVCDIPNCLSRSLTITNKALQYLLAGIGVISADTQGQKEVASNAPGAVFPYPPGDTDALAMLLNTVTADPHLLKVAGQNALTAAENTYSWERSEPTLLKRVAESLKQ
jgi:glycosyltransferase involved in cell wall biosynthesis